MATAARAKKGSVEAGMYQVQSIEEDARYTVTAAALPANRARLLVLLLLSLFKSGICFRACYWSRAF